MPDPIPFELPLAHSFELEKMCRIVDSTTDANQLQQICKQVLQAWFYQKAATAWVMRQALTAPPSNLTESTDALFRS